MAEESTPRLLPEEPIERLIRPLTRFLHIEAASGVVLLICAVIALAAANSPIAENYLAFWKTKIGFVAGGLEFEHSLKHWINDGLMAIFFFVIGLEVKRELVVGELRDFRRATLPLAAALGGMILPAGVYLAFQWGEPGESGWGVPMATDIAFVVGCMAVLGRRIPAALRVTLLSLAIVDDIGAILVIAIGYTDGIQWIWLGVGAASILGIAVMQQLGVRSFLAYTVAGIVTWIAFHESGVHATIAGVIIGLMTPAKPYLDQTTAAALLRRASEFIHEARWPETPGRVEYAQQSKQVALETVPPLDYLIYILHPWVAFGVMPVFALANAGVAFSLGDVIAPVSVAVIAGLVAGKPLGVLLFSWSAVALRVADLPKGVNWGQMLGGGCLAGIGFTMALFISGLAFDDPDVLRRAKVGVLAGSLLAGALGFLLLLIFAKPAETPSAEAP